LEIGVDGLDEHTTDSVRIEKELAKAGPKRLWYVADAFRKGMTLENIHGLTNIDPWFLSQIQEIVTAEHALLGKRLLDIDQDYLWALKKDGFSDRRLARLMNTDEENVRSYRWSLGIHPVY
jgi:carbamoyl-phosphate synthase large subunit